MSSSTANPHATRETIESVVVAVILAFLFRGFVAEAFIIPTGSMAPTLQGNHKDLACEKCGYQYQAGASCENEGREPAVVAETICPICRYQTKIDADANSDHASFAGDRILVSKFAYEIGDPQRWDVIVFKFPHNAKQNYIKRLVGLPNETLQIGHGDVWAAPKDTHAFNILRKPPHKLKAMLQLVDDSRHIPAELRAANWPSRWQSWPPKELRHSESDSSGIPLIAEGDDESWLRYRHHVPDADTWEKIQNGEKNLSPSRPDGQLITDFYPYNAFVKGPVKPTKENPFPRPPTNFDLIKNGQNWVGDLAIECEVEVNSNAGHLLFDLVEGGVHHRCDIDLSNGQATLDIVGDEAYGFVDENGPAGSNPVGAIGRHGNGVYHIRFANVDNELHLWVNESLIPFTQTTKYQPPSSVVPTTSPTDPGDLAPLGIGVRGATAHIRYARVLRDVYYITGRGEYEQLSDQDILQMLHNPDRWSSLFESRMRDTYFLGDEQYFPMGDNSPQSSDARLWSPPQYVERELLLGKALFVYWPHTTNHPIPYTPNLGRMRLIR